MSLFCNLGKEVNIVDSKNTIKTPLEDLYFEVVNDDIKINTLSNYETGYLNEKSIFIWDNNVFKAELITYKPEIIIPEGMKVEDFVVVVWRLKAKINIDKIIRFKCVWQENYLWKDYGPNSGEHLDAQTWENNKIIVTIGTEDSEILRWRSELNKMIPKYLAKEPMDIYLDIVEYSSLGLYVPISSMEKNEICHIHFAVSWGKDETATWYCVDETSNKFFNDETKIIKDD